MSSLKRFLSLALALMMVISMMPTTAFATGDDETTPPTETTVTEPSEEAPSEEAPSEEAPSEEAAIEPSTEAVATADVAYVAQVGETLYATLQEAINAAGEGATITLVDDIEQVDGVVITDKNLTIDLNGKTFTVTTGGSTNSRNMLINGASVVTVMNGTMVAAGDINSGCYGTVRTEGNPTVTLSGLKLYNYRGNGLNIKAVGGNVTVSDTEIYAQYGGGIEAAGATMELNNVKVEQKGMWTAPYNSMAISVNGDGKVTVHSGTYTTEPLAAEDADNQGSSHGSWAAGVLNSGGTLIIKGGTFSNDNFGDNADATAARGLILADTGAVIKIEGGTFNALKGIVDIQNNLDDASKNPTGTITGGEFSANPVEGFAGGYVAVETGSTIVVAGTTYTKTENGLEEYVPPVAKVGDVEYSSLQEAIKAAAPNGTVELLNDVTVDEWKMITEKTIGSDQLITLVVDGMTINGNDHTLTVKAIESAGNGNHLFDDARNLTVKDLTIVNNSGKNGGIGLTSGLISNVTFVGGVGVFPGTGDITITGCTFEMDGDAIYFEEERDNLIVDTNVFNVGGYAIILRGGAEFTNNTVTSGKVNVANSATGEISGNSFGDNRFKVYNAATATISNNTINNLVFNDETVAKSTFTDNTLSASAEEALSKVMPVASVNGTAYASLQEALKALTAENNTLEILADVTIDEYWDARYTGGKIMIPVVINGNDHTLKFTNTVYDAGNYLSVFRFEADATVKDLTIDMSEAVSGFAGRFRAISAKADLIVDNCTFIGNGSTNNTRAIIYGEGAGTALTEVDVSITNSKFVGWKRGISDNEGGKDAKSVVVTGNTFTDASAYLSATDSITFTGNTVSEGAAVDIRSYTETVEVEATGNTMTANANTKVTNAVSYDNIQSEFQINAPVSVTSGETTKYFATLQAAIDAAGEGDTVTLLDDIKLTAGITVTNHHSFTLDGNGFSIAPADSTVALGYQAVYFIGGGTITIEDLTFKDFVQANVTGPVLRLEGAEQFNLTNVTFNNCDVARSVGTADSVMRVYDTNFAADGLVMTGCKGGMLMDIGPSSNYFIGLIEIENSRFEGNTARGTALIYTNLTQAENSYLSISNTVFKNNVISDADSQGRGVIHLGSDAVIDGCTFDGNKVYGSHTSNVSYGINEYSGHVLSYTNNTFTNNAAYQTYANVGSVAGTAMMAVGEATVAGNTVEASNAFYHRASANASFTAKTARSVGTYNDSYGKTTITSGTYYGELVSYNGIEGFNITGGSFSDHTSLYKFLSEEYDTEYDKTTGLFAVEAVPVAIVNNVIYTDLEEALAAAKNGSELVLQRNVTLSDTLVIPADYNVVLNMNGYTISQSKACTASYTMIENKGNLTITGNGKISFTDTGAGDPAFGWGSYTITNRGTLTVENGTIEHLGAQAFATHMICAIQQAGGTVTINGGTISTPNYRSVRVNKGDLVINGGTFDGQIWLQPNQGDATLVVTGGEFEPNGRDASAIFMTNAGENKTVTSAAISGGTFKGKIGATDASKLAGAVSGGIFTEAAKNGTNAALLATDLVFAGEADANGYYSLVDDPYHISDLAELKAFRDDVNAGNTYKGKTVTLGADIDLAGEAWTPIGTKANYFQGTFDGGEHTISNLCINDADLEYAGLFGYSNGAKINNVNIKNVDIYAYSHTGAVVGSLYIGSATNCHVSGTIKLVSKYAYAGGITGYGYNNIYDCSVIAEGTGIVKVEEKTGAGGIIGWHTEGNLGIYNCTAKNLEITAWTNLGGITGFVHYNNTIDGCKVENVTLTKTRVDGQAGIGLAAGGWAAKSDDNYTITITNNTFNNVTMNGVAINSHNQLIGSNYSYYDKVANLVESGNAETNVVSNIKVVVNSEADLEKALAYCNDGETIYVGSDFAVTKALTNSKVRVLDLNGYTITGTDNYTSGSFGLITNKGDLTITDSSEEKNGKITLTATTDRDWNAYSSVISNTVGGKFTLEAGTLEHLGGTDMAYGIDNLTNGKATYAETIINGGTIKSTYRGIRQFLNGIEAQNILTVNGGTIEGTNKSIWMQDPSKNANTGTLTVSENATLKGDVYLSVTEGSTEWPVEVSISAAALADGSEVVTGNVPAGYELTEVDGTYSVYSGVAKIGTEYFDTLTDALAAVQEGETIELLAGTIDLGGDTVDTKLPTTMTNVTIKGAEGHASVIKNGFLIQNGSNFNLTGVTFDGVVFEDAYIVLTPWDGNSFVKDFTINNCVFQNLDDANTMAPLHATQGGIQNLTFTNNVVKNLTGGNKSGVYAWVSGDVEVSGNTFDGIQFRPVLLQVRNNDGIADTVNFTNNTVTNCPAGRVQILGTGTGGGVNGADTVAININENSFTGITNTEQLCVYNFNAEKTNADLSKNYYDVDILANPNNIYYNDEAQNAADLIEMGVYPYYADEAKTELVEAPAIMVEYPVGNPVYPEGKIEYYDDMLEAVPYTTNCPRLEGATITLLKDVSGAGMRFMENDMVFDLNGHTYTITAGTGSQGTNTSGFQIRPEVTTDVIFKNGTIKVAEGAPVVWMFNCYATDFIVEDVTVDCTNMAWSYGESCYVAVSRAEDNVQFTGNTKIENFNSEVAGHAINVGGTMTIGENVVPGGSIELDAGAVLTAPAGLTVVTADGYEVVYADGVYTSTQLVAAIGDKQYISLQAAIDAAGEGDTVKLLSNATGDVIVAEGQNIVIDLDGNDIVGSMNGIINNGTLTINDSVGTGNVYTTDVAAQGRATIVNNGTITINGGWFGDSNNDTTDRNAINRGNALKNYGTATINGGYFTNVSNQFIGTDAYAYAINTLTGGTTTINNATVYGDINGLIFSDGKTIVEDGSFTLGRPNEENNLWYLAYGNVEIKGGSWDRAFAVPSWNTGDPKFMGEVEVSGGTFNVTVPEANCAEGFICVKNADGTYGVIDDPKTHYIYDLAQLKAFRDDVNAGNTYEGITVYLAADIDLGNEEWTPIGIGAGFKGIFDGQDNTISNLSITGNNSTVGLFANTYNGEIRNLTIENAKVSGRLNVGVVAGNPYTSKYTNITVTGHVEVNGMSYVGGVGGKNAYANWTDITVDADDTSYVKATSTENGTAYRSYVGGVVGFNGEGGHTFKNISSNIDVIGDVCDVGGIFGIAHYGNNFVNITCTGDVTNTTSDAENALETGLIAGTWNNGGSDVTFDNIEATGAINTPNVEEAVNFHNGGLIGSAYSLSSDEEGKTGELIIDDATVWPAAAKIGDEYYATLQAAIDAAEAGETVTALKDITLAEGIVIAVDDEITLDLNGKTISRDTEATSSTAAITNNGNLTITDSATGGKITAFAANPDTAEVPYYANNTITNCGVLTVKGGTIENSTGDDARAAYPIDNNSTSRDAIVNIEGGTVTGRGAIRQFANSTTNKNEVNITGGTVTGSSYGIWMQNPGSKDPVASLNISGGEVAKVLISPSANFELSITGGTIDTVAIWEADATNTERNPSGFITGGSFKDPAIEAFVADGYTIAYANGMYGVKLNPVAKVGGVEYATLAAAVEAAKDGETVYVLRDVTLQQPVTVAAGKAITLDLMTNTVLQEKACTEHYAMITNNGDLTITGNGTISFKDTGAGDPNHGWGSYTIVNNGKLTVENGTIENTTAKMSHAYYTIQNGGNGEVTITGGKIINETNYAIRQFASGTQTNTITVNGGEVIGTRAVWMQAAGSKAENAPAITLNVNGGTLTGTGETGYKLAVYSYSYGDSLENVAINISDGTINGDIALTGGANKTAAEKVTVTGGTFNGFDGDLYSYAADEVAVPAISIKGGTFASNAAEVYATDDGYKFVTNSDGMYVLEKLPYVAMIGEQGYLTITDAINAAADGDTIQLLPGTFDEAVDPWGADSTHAVEKSITIVGAADFGTTLTGGLVLGYDDNGCRAHTITIKGIAFEDKGIVVAGQQNVVIDGNKFTNITEEYDSRTANVNAISVLGKNINATVTNNIIDTVENGGIHLRDIKSATVTGNTVSNTGDNAITVVTGQNTEFGDVVIENNTLTNWGISGEGRAMRINGAYDVSVNENVMTHTDAPEQFAKVTGYASLDASANYWNGVSPETDGIFAVDTTDTFTAVDNLVSYYTDADKTNLEYILAPVAKIGNVQYSTLQEAVNAAAAGDVIELIGDVSDDFIIVNKPLSIKTTDEYTISEDMIFCGKYLDPSTNKKVALSTIEMADGIIIQQVTVSDADAGEALAYVDVNAAGHDGETLMTLQAALDAAEAAGGGTVKMKGDLSVKAIVVIPTGVTLDIEANTLTVKSLIGVTGSKLTGTYDIPVDGALTGGLLKVDKQNVILPAEASKVSTYSVLPVWDPTASGYRFELFFMNTDASKNRGLTVNTDENNIRFQFKHQTLTDVNQHWIKNYGGAELGLSVVARVEWERVFSDGSKVLEYHTFVYTDEMIKTAVGSYDYFFVMTGIDEINVDLNTLNVSAMLVTDTGATAYSANWGANGLK